MIKNKEIIMNKKKYGTREWSDHSFNIGVGCSNGCLYCYAKDFSLKKGFVKSEGEWRIERTNAKKVAMNQPVYDGVVMFPTAHDITPFYLDDSIKVIGNLLGSGNRVLVVTKARMDCMERMCSTFEEYKDTDQLEFRVTIGCMHAGIAKDWEPGAPSPNERIEALKYAYGAGYNTSVSIEPMLENDAGALQVVQAVYPYVTGDIWIGKLNKVRERVNVSDLEVEAIVRAIEINQSDKEILSLHDCLKDLEKIKWKDSILKVLLRNNIIQ